jgi:hypothetical protein
VNLGRSSPTPIISISISLVPFPVEGKAAMCAGGSRG